MKQYLILFAFITSLNASAQPSPKTMHMNNFITDSAAIAVILTDVYFKGIYEGDVRLLSTAYYEGTLLFGDAAGKAYFKTLKQYLDGVANRQSPMESGKPFKGTIHAIDVTGSIAMAKVSVKMYAFNYQELLSFHELDGKWLIVNKMIHDVQE
ncbi:MAG TPA: nuclear transport factor 2 family protein [Puia sp.]|jgi:hypothetical protein|nr:nuclear transport factor 2 family protein [Puia sp.]